eukprot:COSAG02_NODE_5807_length_4023_cov_4.606014_2_plen_78_part_00
MRTVETFWPKAAVKKQRVVSPSAKKGLPTGAKVTTCCSCRRCPPGYFHVQVVGLLLKMAEWDVHSVPLHAVVLHRVW